MALGRCTKIISMIRWIRTSRLSIKDSLSLEQEAAEKVQGLEEAQGEREALEKRERGALERKLLEAEEYSHHMEEELAEAQSQVQFWKEFGWVLLSRTSLVQFQRHLADGRFPGSDFDGHGLAVGHSGKPCEPRDCDCRATPRCQTVFAQHKWLTLR